MKKALLGYKRLARIVAHAAMCAFLLVMGSAFAQTPTFTTIRSAQNPTLTNQQFALLVQVNQTAATGNVVFKNGTTTIGTAPLINGRAKLVVSIATAGSHGLWAQYMGGGGYSGSSAFGTTQTVYSATALPTASSPVPVVNYTYDAQGNETSATVAASTPSLNLVTSRAFDGLGRPISQTNPSSETIQLTYNALNGLSTVTDARGVVTTSNRDVWDQLQQLQSPDTGTATQTHDNAGNLSTRIDSRGVLATYTYDALDRPTAVAYTKAGQPSQSLQWTYDQTGAGFANGIGRLTTASFPEGYTRYSYDVQGRLTAAVQTLYAAPGGNVVPLTHSVGYAYNAAGKLTSVTYPSGRQLQISYTDGLPSSVAVAQTAGGVGTPLMTNLQYSPFGPLQSWNWAMNSGSVAHVRSFDASGRMQRYRIGHNIRENVYDEAGRIVGIKSYLVGADQTMGAYLADQSRQYVYDRAGRLTAVRDTAGADLVTYTYDANGNRTQSKTSTAGATSTYTISPTSNRLFSATYPHFTMSTDEAGNKTGDGNYTLTYDLRGRLATLSIEQGSAAQAPGEALSARSKLAALSVQSFTYAYDSAGLRVRKINSIGAGATQIYVYDQDQKLLGEYDANGNVLREYLWLDDMPIAVLSNDLGTWQALPIHADHLNTPRAVTDLDNIVRWSWFNPTDVFGKDYAVIDPHNLGAVYVNLRFPGQVYDGESGMHYNVHRDYVPSLGRYAQSDPIGLDGGINTYGYANANPLSFADPTGELAIVLPWVIPSVTNGIVYFGAAAGAAWAAHKVTQEQCKDDDDPCDIMLDKGQLKSAGIRGREHEVKGDELGTNKNLSKFDLCGCKDGRVVVKAHGCKGPVISVTSYRWK